MFETITVRAAINGVPVHAVIRMQRPAVRQEELNERLLRRLHELEQIGREMEQRDGC